MTFKEEFKNIVHPKNQILADIFFKGGLIEAWGRGTLKIINECKNFGLPEPDIDVLTGGICVTIYKNQLDDKYLDKLDLSERQRKAIEYLKTNNSITNKNYQDINDCSSRTASRDLSDSMTKELIKSSDKKGSATFYELIKTIKP